MRGRRSFVLALLLSGVAVGWWASRDAPPVGAWRGETAEGLPLVFFVSEGDDGLEIDRWQIHFYLRCERSGRRVHAGVVSTIRVPIRRGRFALDARPRGAVYLWNGALADASARGDFTAVWAALVGRELETIEAEKCVARDISWKARPGAREEGAVADVVFELARDAGGALRLTTRR